ncbi:TetR/AcrR family transcriptional regulator [Caballeronia sp. BR00000012568055]|uniref:TetR/AcrR family transcriptional regulator n=1 Tax=Caballeronia sp. BR00000012568055 TaxID=2918761 RepID=UPI0023F8FB63|nr:TetR/AcrR family transcriptional regulator [Caballeronia sp. BR00000012568055]
MKVSKEQAELNRIALLDAASRLYRRHGFDGVGVAQIAREAGLTHGSLYGHFESKDHYAAEACAHAFKKSLDLLKRFDDDGDQPLASFRRRYLSEAYRDDPGNGCTIAALAADAARKPGPVAETMTQGIESFIDAFTERLDGREHAMTTLSMMVGALILARASAQANASLSKELLDTVLGTLDEPGA